MKSFSFQCIIRSLPKAARRLAFVSFAMAAVNAAAVTYVKSDAPEGGDGLSWATAFYNIETAVEDAAAKDGVLYVAAGIYPVTNGVTVSGELEVYGGFPGALQAETLQDRDPDQYQTIISGDFEQNDYWVHVEPLEGQYKFTRQELPDQLLFVEGQINNPPPYTGDYDSYYLSIRGTNGQKTPFTVAAGASGIFDGLAFVGLKKSSIVAQKDAGKVEIRNCRFIGNNASGQVMEQNGNTLVTGCRFRFSRGGSGAAISMSSRTVVEDSLFEGFVREGQIASGGVLNWSSGGHFIRRCVFTRCADQSKGADSETWHGGSGTIVANDWGKGMFIDCVISNCLSMSLGKAGFPLLNLRNGTIARCSFINNRYEVKPAAYGAYALFGPPTLRQEKGTTYEGCVFRGNAISAPSVAAAEGDYALGIVGSPSGEGMVSLVNCTFDSNTAECAEVEGVTPVLSRAILSASAGVEYEKECGVANCTFSGPAVPGVYDIVQYGQGHTSPLNVVNSIFMAEGAPHFQPFYVTSPENFAVYDCTIGDLSPMEYGYPMPGLHTDGVPFYRDGDATVSHVPVLVPAANVPGLRETADVATNAVPGLYATFRFRLRGEEEWRPLLPAAGNSETTEAAPIPDANGNPRSFGAFTRGASQALTPLAETGATLIVRREPLLGGTLSSPSTQSVEPGTAITPVEAFHAAGASFEGWYENGSRISVSPVLTIDPLEGNRIVTAKFTPPRVNVVFDLGAGGYFSENGKSVISVSVQGGDPFPEVPPYVESEDWLVLKWDKEFPPFVTGSDEVYHAELMTKAVRVFHVVPECDVPTGSDRTGSSWENATADFEKAYREAGVYRGEVWMKEGVYPVTNALIGKSNVAIIGGFSGTETSSAEADPIAHPTILTGDLKGNNYWRPESAKNIPLAEQRPVWTDGSFLEPHPEGNERFWSPGGNNDDDALYFMKTGVEVVTNASVEGVALTGFKKSAFRLDSGDAPSVKIRNCRFLANATGLAWQSTGVIYVDRGHVECEDCEFIGNYLVAWVASIARETPSVFRRCLFRENASMGTTACLHARGQGELLAEGCTFTSNCVFLENWGSAAVLNTESKHRSVLRDCLISDNRIYDTAYGAVRISSTPDEPILIERCRFIGNEAKTKGNGVEKWNTQGFQSPCIAVGSASRLLVRDCYFEGNRIEAGPGGTLAVAGSVLAQRVKDKATTTLLNCTVLDNESRSTTTAESSVGTFAALGGSGFALVNCLVDGSTFAGGASEFSIATSAEKDSTIAVINSIVRNASAGYEPFSVVAPCLPAFANSAISGFDPGIWTQEGDGYLYEMASEAGPFSSVKTGPDGIRAQGVAGSSPYVKKGRSVWLAPDGDLYFHDPEANPDKPWRKVLSKTFHGAEVEGISLESPLAPDAFGAPRRPGRVAYGPLNAASLGTFIMLR